MIDLLKAPWPWYFSGPMIALILFLMLFFGKSFGVSGTFRQVCAAFGAGTKVEFFNFDWKAQKWNLFFAVGAIIGGVLTAQFLIPSDYNVALSSNTIDELAELGIDNTGGLLPDTLFSLESLTNPLTWFVLVIGGFLVGFGARYAGGCTSGHAISGLSNLQFPSLIAVVGFFLGGLIMTHFLFPIIFQ